MELEQKASFLPADDAAVKPLTIEGVLVGTEKITRHGRDNLRSFGLLLVASNGVLSRVVTASTQDGLRTVYLLYLEGGEDFTGDSTCDMHLVKSFPGSVNSDGRLGQRKESTKALDPHV
jgi:hypothetical protein